MEVKTLSIRTREPFQEEDQQAAGLVYLWYADIKLIYNVHEKFCIQKLFVSSTLCVPAENISGRCIQKPSRE